MFDHAMREHSPDAATMSPVTLDLKLDVGQRLQELQTWRSAWQTEDQHLAQRLTHLDPTRRVDVLRGSQILSLRRQLALQISNGIIHPSRLSRLAANNI